MDENIILFIVNLFVFVLCAGLYIIIPGLTRKSFLFGVKIPPQESDCPQAAGIRKNYTISCLTSSAVSITLCVLQFIFWRDKTVIAALYLPLLVIAVYLVSFIPGWKKAVKLKEEKGWVVSNALFAETNSSHTRGDLSALPFGWYIAGFLIVIISIFAAVLRYPLLSDSIPVHFNYNMEPDRWMDKSWRAVLQMPLLNTGLLALMFLVGVSVEKAKLQLDPNNPRLSFAQHKVYRKRMGHVLGFLTVVITVIITMSVFLSVFPDAALSGRKYFFWCIMVLSLLAVFPVIVVTIKTGQGGCKVKINLDETGDTNAGNSDSEGIKGRGDDRYWLLGMFYYNPVDPAIIVEARFGTKLSFNFARLSVKTGVLLFFIALAAMYFRLTAALL